MHVIMNAGRLFVSVPSAGNIGHFEFSIFNALVSPFAGPSSLDVPSHPSSYSSSFSFPLPHCFLPHLVARESALVHYMTVLSSWQKFRKDFKFLEKWASKWSKHSEEFRGNSMLAKIFRWIDVTAHYAISRMIYPVCMQLTLSTLFVLHLCSSH